MKKKNKKDDQRKGWAFGEVESKLKGGGRRNFRGGGGERRMAGVLT